MPPPLSLPVRILVKGASTVNWVSPMGGPRSDFIFSRVLEDELLAAGRPCDLRTITMPSERVKTVLGSWQREILGFSPDVIVLVYGHYETIHLFLPHWLERHANSLKARPTRTTGRLYRRLVLRPLWMALARLQAKVDLKLDPSLNRRRPQRVAADLEHYIAQVQQVGSPLIYLFELLPPTSRYTSWFPGMTRRIDIMNAAISAMVERIGQDNVRYFRVRDLVDEHLGGDIAAATPDGFHYSPSMHRHIGATLARDIEKWISAQPHFDRATRDA